MRGWRSGRVSPIEAAAVAAAALLALKIVELLAGPPAEAPPSVAELSPGEPNSFARALAKARTNYEPPEVAMTGAVSAKPVDPDKEKGAAKAATEAGAPASPAQSTSERGLLERLGQRRDALERRDQDIAVRERLLENAERKIEGRINELKGLEKSSGPEAKREPDPAFQSVVTMYEAMKPKDAARVFDRLPLDVLVPVVLKMNPRKMAEVLAIMTPEGAEKLTIALATRAKNPDGALKSAAVPDLPSSELAGIDAPPAPQRRP